jgi:hypothetical protein
MANDTITYTKITFDIEDEVTHCEIRWNSTDSHLTGSGARRTYGKSFSVVDIMSDFAKNDPLIDPKWARIA